MMAAAQMTTASCYVQRPCMPARGLITPPVEMEPHVHFAREGKPNCHTLFTAGRTLVL